MCSGTPISYRLKTRQISASGRLLTDTYGRLGRISTVSVHYLHDFIALAAITTPANATPRTDKPHTIFFPLHPSPLQQDPLPDVDVAVAGPAPAPLPPASS